MAILRLQVKIQRGFGFESGGAKSAFHIAPFHSVLTPFTDGYNHEKKMVIRYCHQKAFQRIFLSSDPDNDAIKELVYDCLYLPWLKGEFMPESAPEWAGSYLIALQKAKMSTGAMPRLAFVAFEASHL